MDYLQCEVVQACILTEIQQGANLIIIIIITYS